jgi:hypothetical protein
MKLLELISPEKALNREMARRKLLALRNYESATKGPRMGSWGLKNGGLVAMEQKTGIRIMLGQSSIETASDK